MPRTHTRRDEAPDPLLVPKIVLLVEGAVALIAVATTVVPSKTGSDWSFAELFWDHPSFVQKVAVAFVVTNMLLAILAVVGYLVVKSSRGGASQKP